MLRKTMFSKHRSHLNLALSATLLLSLLNHCASSKVQLASTPRETQVYVTGTNGGTPILLGKTPLNLESQQILSLAKVTGPVQFEFRKEGYTPFKIFVTDITSSDITLNPELARVGGIEDLDVVNRVVDELFEAQRLARVGRYDEALERVKFVQKETPQLSAAFEIEGAIYYLKKDFKRSLDAYRTAEKRNPKAAEATQMKKLIEREIAGK